MLGHLAFVGRVKTSIRCEAVLSQNMKLVDAVLLKSSSLSKCSGSQFLKNKWRAITV
jgi:hypothetical protein